MTFVRALYAYQAPDDSGLNFERGDVIQVLNVLPSGWWDGYLNGKRGWFPSNFVEPEERRKRQHRPPPLDLSAAQVALHNGTGPNLINNTIPSPHISVARAWVSQLRGAVGKLQLGDLQQVEIIRGIIAQISHGTGGLPREIMSALSKLTLAGPEEIVREAEILVTSTDRYLETVDHVEPARPVMLAQKQSGGAWRTTGSQPISEEAVMQLESLSRLVRSEIQSTRIKARSEHPSVVVRDVLELLTPVKEFLKACEQLDLSALDAIPAAGLTQSPTVLDFVKTKQALYDTVADVVVETQNLTAPHVDRFEAGYIVSGALSDLEHSMQSILMNAEFLVQELNVKYTPARRDPEPPATGDVLLDTKGNIRAGTLSALVDRLVREDAPADPNYLSTFLLTYKLFTNGPELGGHLLRRYVDGNRRTVEVLRTWLEQYFVEPPNTPETRQLLNDIRGLGEAVLAEPVSDRIQGRPLRTLAAEPTSVGAPQPILPRSLRKVKLLEVDPLEIARQLTILESSLYAKIQPMECLEKVWTGNIKDLIRQTNEITAWVAEAILYQLDPKKRVALIRHFIHVAIHCRSLKNFSSLVAIISGLNSAPIYRLRRTWELLNARSYQQLDDMNTLMNSSKNFLNYRDALHQVQPPCLPFLGVYLTDLTFIADGNPDLLRNMINVSKHAKTAEVIRDILAYQSMPYALQEVPEIQRYIRSCLAVTRDITHLYAISLEREPREREDEKIARLLQESGFL
ncbi:cell division cycle-related protein [Savitreella phatthalungensis]